MNNKEIVARRFYNSGLLKKFENVDNLIMGLFGIQSQYYNHALYNIYNRFDYVSESGANFLQDTKLILGWGQRNTLHIYNYEVWRVINAFLQQKTWVEKYFTKQNIDLNSEIDYFYNITNHEGMLITDLKNKYKDRWSPIFDWSALFLELSRRGEVYLTIDEMGKKFHFFKEAYSLSISKKEIAYQYFSHYGPATISDLSHFLKISKRIWKEENFEDLESFEHEGNIYYYIKNDFSDYSLKIPPVILIGKYDPLLVAYAKKDIIIPNSFHKLVWGEAGQISPVIFVSLKFAGIWNFRVAKNSIDFRISLIERYKNESIQNEIKNHLSQFSNWLGKSRIRFNWTKLNE